MYVDYQTVKNTGTDPDVFIALEFTPYNKKQPWMVLQPIRVKLSNGASITIPKGMKTDLSSSPKLLWGLYPPFGKFLLATLIHDYMYLYDYKRLEMGDKAARKFADKEMYLWSQALQPKKWLGNYTRYLAVRWFGGIVYAK